MREAKACAKFILSGEHSIVYHGGGVVFPIEDLQIQLSIEDNQTDNKVLVNDTDVTIFSLPTMYKVFQAMDIYPSNNIHVTIKSNIPIGMGLGSSAAFCTALARAFNPDASDEKIALIAMAGETVIHGSSSGIDPFATTIAKPIYFTSDDKSWRDVNLKQFREENLCFALISTNLAHTTKNVIEQCQLSQNALSKEVWMQHMEQLSMLAQKSLSTLESNPSLLGSVMNDIQKSLRTVRVSNTAIEEKIDFMMSQGALGAKLTGAGCGGYVLGLFRKEQFENSELIKHNPIVFS